MTSLFPALFLQGGESVSWTADLHAHGDWLDSALYNGVLGTQRGVQPGAMVYMMPLGGGVSKAGGNHGYSNSESHFWCCMGSAIEAFTKLHASVFYRRPSASGRVHELIVLQYVPSTLTWSEANCNVSLAADAAGEVRSGAPLVATLLVSRYLTPRRTPPCPDIRDTPTFLLLPR